MKATPPPSRHRSHHRTMRANARHLAPMDPLHFPTNIDQAHLIWRRTQATQPSNHHHYSSKCGASKKGMTLMAPLSHVHKWTELTPLRNLCRRTRCIAVVPLNRENDATRALPPLPSTKVVSEGFHPIQHHARRANLDRSVNHPSSPPRHLYRPKNHHDATSKHQTPQPHHQGDARPISPSKERMGTPPSHLSPAQHIPGSHGQDPVESGLPGPNRSHRRLLATGRPLPTLNPDQQASHDLNWLATGGHDQGQLAMA